MVNLEWYRTFKMVYETGSLTAASKLLFISQPNVSQHIAALEAHIGKPLFERKHKVIPTDYAKIIYRQIEEPLYKLEEVEATFKKMCLTKSKPTITIGIEKEYINLLGDRPLNSLPAIFIIHTNEISILLNKLAIGEIDFLISSTDDTLPKFTKQNLFDDHYSIIADDKMETGEVMSLIKKKDLTNLEKWLLQQNWVSTNAEMQETRMFWKKNFKKIPVIVPNIIIPDQRTLIEIVSQGSSLAIMSQHQIEKSLSQQKLKIIWSGNTHTKKNVSLQYNPMKVPTSYLSFFEILFDDNDHKNIL